MEQWKDVVGYEGLYEVSNLGNVRNKRTGKVLKPTITVWGYYKLNLYKNSRMYSKTVHRIVAEAWIPLIEGKDQVNHINEIKTDNRVDNLEWCTVDYNNLYGTHVDRVYDTLVNNGYIKHPERRHMTDKEKNHLRYLDNRNIYRRRYVKERTKSLLKQGKEVPLWGKPEP